MTPQLSFPIINRRSREGDLDLLGFPSFTFAAGTEDEPAPAASIMWLLNSSTSELRYFISEEDLPPYAILSHTWGKEEVAYQDWQAAYSDQKRYGALPEDWKERNRCILQALQGYKKIVRCQQQAHADGLHWVWIDT